MNKIIPRYEIDENDMTLYFFNDSLETSGDSKLLAYLSVSKDDDVILCLEDVETLEERKNLFENIKGLKSIVGLDEDNDSLLENSVSEIPSIFRKKIVDSYNSTINFVLENNVLGLYEQGENVQSKARTF